MSGPSSRTSAVLLPLVPVVWSVLLAVGCHTPEPMSRQEPASGEDIPILWQKSGSHSRITRLVRVVARDQATLAQLPITEVPVDFDTQMVLIVGIGPTPADELGIRITRVWRQGSALRVQERRIHPGTEHSIGLEPGSPWTVAVVPRSDLNVEGFSTRVPPGALGEYRRP